MGSWASAISLYRAFLALKFNFEIKCYLYADFCGFNFGIFGYKFERWVPSVTKWIHFRDSIYSWSGEFWWSIFHFILDRQCDCIFDVRIFVVKMNELERKWSWWQTKWANSQKIHFRLDFEPSGLNITTLARQEVISIARSDTVAASGQFRKIVDK